MVYYGRVLRLGGEDKDRQNVKCLASNIGQKRETHNNGRLFSLMGYQKEIGQRSETENFFFNAQNFYNYRNAPIKRRPPVIY